jgi:HEAT repeat protein
MPEELTPPAPKKVSFNEVTSALLDNNRPFPPRYLHHFSDISVEDMNSLKKAWPDVKADRRASIIEAVEEINDSDTLVNFDLLARYGLVDADPRVRAGSIRLLWECGDKDLPDKYIKMMNDDVEPIVRAAAASALGMFEYMGELEEIPEALFHRVEESLMNKYKSDDEPLVRRQALEALGFSSRPEMYELIKAASQIKDNQWLSAALFAMGRSADIRWEPKIRQYIESPDPEIQVEAIRAAGQLELSSCRELLLELLENAQEMDEEVRQAVVWSLSQIGGETVRARLEGLMEELEDDDEVDFIAEALDNLTFNEGFQLFDMLDLDDIASMEEDLDAPGNGKKPRRRKE